MKYLAVLFVSILLIPTSSSYSFGSSLEPKAVAILYQQEENARAYTTMLQDFGFTCTLIHQREYGKIESAPYDLVIVLSCCNTSIRSPGSFYVDFFDKIGDARVLALGVPGGTLFGLKNLQIQRDCAWHGSSQKRIIFPQSVLSGSFAAVLKSPHNLLGDGDEASIMVIPESKEVYHSGIYDCGQFPEGTYGIGREEKDLHHWIICMQGNYVLWGFDSLHSQLTEEGKQLFTNLCVYLANLEPQELLHPTKNFLDVGTHRGTLKGGWRDKYYFKTDKPGKMRIQLEWTKDTSMMLRQASYYPRERKDGRSPLVIEHTISEKVVNRETEIEITSFRLPEGDTCEYTLTISFEEAIENMDKKIKSEKLLTDENYFNDHYYKVFPYRLSWKKARQTCLDMGGYLACITSPEENRFILNLVRKIPCPEFTCCWIGGMQNPSTNDWEWISAESLEMTHNLVVDDNSEYYLNLRVQNGLWEDYPDDGEQIGQQWFACEWPSRELVNENNLSEFLIHQSQKQQETEIAQAQKIPDSKGKFSQKPLPELEYTDLNGNLIKLSDLKGNVVVLDFWATWCGPCRTSTPYLIETYKKYKDKNFCLLGISLDQDKSALLEYIEKHQMSWPQYYDGLGWDNKLWRQLGEGGIPMIMVIDQNGIVKFSDIEASQLENVVSTLLNPNAPLQDSVEKKAMEGDADAQNRLGVQYYENGDYTNALKYYRMAAEKGLALAQFNLGVMYRDGNGVKQDYQEAINWFTKSANQNCASAQYALALFYEMGRGIDSDFQKAFKWYTKAAENNYPMAQNNLARLYFSGEGVPQDFQKAFELFSQAAEQNIPQAYSNIAMMYKNGYGVLQDYKKAAEFYEKAANLGYAWAQNRLGHLYYQGLGVKQDYIKAVELYKKAAEQGLAMAQYNTGTMYQNGHGVPKDYQEAIKWFHMAAKQGFSNAYLNLGNLYMNGYGVPRDYKEAAYFFKKAVEGGNMKAANNLGLLYYQGQGIDKDPEKAIEYFTMAAEQGIVQAQHNLGEAYYIGEGIEHDYKLAFQWLHAAAENGNPQSQAILGILYCSGKIKRDNIGAYQWILLAEMQDEILRKQLSEDQFNEMLEIKRQLQEQMSDQEIAEAEKRSKEFNKNVD